MRFLSVTLVLAAIPAAVLGVSHNVEVGPAGQLKFVPPNITAAVGDTVSFVFNPKNHSVTQSTFADPCLPATFNGSAGVSSGFLGIPPNTTFPNGTAPMWTITITDTRPLWFHCAQTAPVVHCQKGMVFSINETPAKSFAKFLATAKAFNGTFPPPAADAGAAAASAPAASGAVASGAPAASATDASAPAAASSPALANAAATPSGTAAASQASPSTKLNHNSASKVLFTRGTAGLLAIAALGALLL